jgi:hypothetical protein
MTYQDRPLKLRKFSVPFRVVALWHEPSQTWHRYITNAPSCAQRSTLRVGRLNCSSRSSRVSTAWKNLLRRAAP